MDGRNKAAHSRINKYSKRQLTYTKEIFICKNFNFIL